VQGAALRATTAARVRSLYAQASGATLDVKLAQVTHPRSLWPTGFGAADTWRDDIACCGRPVKRGSGSSTHLPDGVQVPTTATLSESRIAVHSAGEISSIKS